MTRRAVVFDVGGVIVRWQPLALMREHLPMAAPETAFAQVFQGWAPGADWGEFDLGRIEPDALAARIAARTGYPLAALAALIAAVPQHLQPMPESVALIERVRAAGHRLALLSNMPRPYADHLEVAHDCFGWFEHRAWSGRLGVMKPGRAIFDHVAAELAIDPREAVFIDDHAGNIEAASALGWSAVRFEHAAQCERDLRERGFL
ncbi:MAG TPA: HAD family phosphatase [Burkholderiaceae bacterium]|nr:HAD family phosphatase [Burkholderiaceae bacterium]